MTTIQPYRPALRAMYVGRVLSAIATIAPYVDHATSNVLAEHIRSGYPAYTQQRIDTAVATWLAILSVVGGIALVSWTFAIWSIKSGRWWSRWAVTAMFPLATTIAMTGLLVKDTSGQTGLPPVLAWIGILPCLAGLMGVMALWRERHQL